MGVITGVVTSVFWQSHFAVYVQIDNSNTLYSINFQSTDSAIVLGWKGSSVQLLVTGLITKSPVTIYYDAGDLIESVTLGTD
jgi:hypothetical protein